MLTLLLTILFIPIINEPNNQPIEANVMVIEKPVGEEYELSAYCLKGIMANGQQVHIGAVACQAFLPFNTKVEIDGKEYNCSDRMHLRYRHRKVIDIWMSDCGEAINFGRRKAKVLIY